MRHLVIIGFMGSGKSTFASMLSSSLNLPVFSTDQAIAEQMQMSIPKIFEVFGEAVFRAQEGKIFESLSHQLEPHIIDCGGGFGFYQEVHQLGEVLFLDIGFEEILQRMNQQERGKRPLFSSLSKARDLFIQRREIYLQKADLILQETNQDAVLAIQKYLKIKI